MNHVIFKDRGPTCILHKVSDTPLMLGVFFILVSILLISSLTKKPEVISFQ
jgi:hypothetical protein